MSFKWGKGFWIVAELLIEVIVGVVWPVGWVQAGRSTASVRCLLSADPCPWDPQGWITAGWTILVVAFFFPLDSLPETSSLGISQKRRCRAMQL